MRSCRTKITVVTTDEASSQHIAEKSSVMSKSLYQITYVGILITNESVPIVCMKECKYY